ncbi:type II toxin-antitoxin system RelE/ParE family toxin [Roseateles sp.]|uniref:type II toxin-antitoxin system RelE/ParE family toxin n=1 Tax=Roseateles sp. TaxID=1971397 RepID=UPI0039452EC1
MTLPIEFLPAAEAELLHEVDYYSQARTGAGIRFQAAVEAAIERAARHPAGGAPAAAGARSMLVRGFPFSVVYRAEPRLLLVVAIAPHRRQPGYWLSRVA